MTFQIIAHAGEARSHYVEAIRLARADDFEKAQQLIEKGEEAFRSIHNLHLSLIQKEAAGEATSLFFTADTRRRSNAHNRDHSSACH